MIELSNDRFSVGIDPGKGGSLAWFSTRAGCAIFRDARAQADTGATASACFPMVPFCNRVRDRRFRGPDGTITLDPNTADGLRTAHGFGWQSKWSVTEHSPCHTVIRHEHAAGCWPWAYAAEQRIRMNDQGLAMVLSVSNKSATSMPAGLGLHPYFPLREGVRLEFNASECFVLDESGFPSPLPDAHPVLAEAAAGSLTPLVGNRYLSGVTGVVIVSDLVGGYVLTLKASTNCSDYALHLERQNGVFCLEPMTHQAGALDDDRLFGPDSGIVNLAPGETLCIEMICAVEFSEQRLAPRRN